MCNIDALEARQLVLQNLPDDAPMKGMRLYANQKALTQAYRIMMEIARRDDSEATDGDEQEDTSTGNEQEENDSMERANIEG